MLDRLINATQKINGTASISPVTAIAGSPGVGKTALALYWADHVRDHFPDGSLYIDMHGYGRALPVTPNRALDVFLRALNVEPDDIPDDLENRASLFRSIVSERRILVVVDNVAASEQARPLLPATPGCCAVITSRSSLQGLVAREGAMRISLDTLSLADSVQLLSELIGSETVANEPAAAARIADLCGRLPLALRVVAERAANSLHSSLMELVDEIEGEQNRLDALASTEDELIDTRAVFSWSYRALANDLKIAFRKLSLHPGSELSAESAAAMMGTSVGVVRRHYRALADVHLVEEVGASRFHFHDLLRSYAYECVLAEETQETRTMAVRRLFTWYLHVADAARRAVLPFSAEVPLVPLGQVRVETSFENASVAMKWFEVERLNLVSLVHRSFEIGQYDMCWKLAMASSALFEIGSYWNDWQENHKTGLAAALALGDRLGEATNTQLLGDAAWRLGELDDAHSRYSRAADLAHDLGIGWLEGFAIRGLGLIAEERGEFKRALQYFGAATAIFRTHDVERGLAMSLLSVGKCQRGQGNLTDAIAAQKRAISILRSMGDTWTLAWASLELAHSLQEMGHNNESVVALQAAIRVFRDFKDPRAEILANLAIADGYESAGDIAPAIQHLGRVCELCSFLGDARFEEVETRLRRLRETQA